MSKLIDLIRAQQRRRSGMDDDRMVVVHDDLPPCTPARLTQILREIDGTGRGLPLGSGAGDNEEGRT